MLENLENFVGESNEENGETRSTLEEFLTELELTK